MNEKIEKTIYDFKDMITDSWTFRKMYHKERVRCMETIKKTKKIGRSKKSVWQQLTDIYTSYLYGLGYPMGIEIDPHTEWREDEPVDKEFLKSIYL